jgi:hypothetical protein
MATAVFGRTRRAAPEPFRDRAKAKELSGQSSPPFLKPFDFQDRIYRRRRRHADTLLLSPHGLRAWILGHMTRLCDRLIAITTIPMMRIKK